MTSSSGSPLDIAIIGTGVSGLAAAWLLSRRHKVTVFEAAGRIGGHTNTIDVACAGADVPVDTGFIVFNPPTYPNLCALFEHLGVATRATDMSFSVSLRGGELEYAGINAMALFAQPVNALRPSFWGMLRDLRRFYASAPGDLEAVSKSAESLGSYLDRNGYGQAFQEQHLLPMAAAIWSAPLAAMRDYPAASFIRFFDNHGLLKLRGRPAWHTVIGGSKRYIAKITEGFANRIRTGTRITNVVRNSGGVLLESDQGQRFKFDHVVIAAHADQALGMLRDADASEQRLLGAFRYTRNAAVLHSDAALMPRRRRVWASWNYVEPAAGDGASVTYWMNRLQGLAQPTQFFVTLNPPQVRPHRDTIIHTETYEHPIFDATTDLAQRQLWSLQGCRNTWFCGAYFGAGFHEDGLQAGLAVAEDLGGERRPWRVEGESARIVRGPRRATHMELA